MSQAAIRAVADTLRDPGTDRSGPKATGGKEAFLRPDGERGSEGPDRQGPAGKYEGRGDGPPEEGGDRAGLQVYPWRVLDRITSRQDR